ncbi:MAG: hypothetical protein ACREIV_14170, partial [Planctomycetaceae bacterium]
MSQSAVPTPHAEEFAPERTPADAASRAAVPGWLASLALHGGLMALLLTTGLRGCIGNGPAGIAEGEFRDVGLYVKDPAALLTPSDQEPAESLTENTADAVFPATTHDAPSESDASNAPPVPLDLPTRSDTPLLGGGAPPPSGVPADVMEDLPKVSGALLPSRAASSGIGQGETAFFNIRDRGTRFVYVLDCSGSMTSYNAIRVAKAELIGSLEGLDKNQQFQIVFYNDTPLTMTLRNETRTQLHWATDVNRTLARQYIAGVPADGGTDHMPALRRALAMQPEVLFFLTDAQQPILTPKNLDEIERLNQGRTRI